MLNADQLAARQGLMTSSVVAAALDRHPHCSPYGAYQRILGLTQDAVTTVFTERGDTLEDITLRWGAKDRGMEMHAADWVAHANGWSGDSCDALYVCPRTGEVHCAEAKTVGLGRADDWGAVLTDEVPAHVLDQCYWHMIHHHTQVCWQPVLVGGYRFNFRMYKVVYDKAYADHLYGEAKDWYDRHVVKQVPPPFTAKDEDLIKERWPEDEADYLEPLDGERAAQLARVQQAAAQYHLWRGRAEMAETRKKTWKVRLADCLGPYAGACPEGFKVSYKNNAPTDTVDWQALARQLGATDDQITQATHSRPGPRVLRVTERKTKEAK